MGRMPQLPSAMVTVPKPDVFPSEESDNWVPYTDDGIIDNAQPSRIRAISLQISHLCELSNDILLCFYNPTPSSASPMAKSLTKSSISAEFKKLGELFSCLEDWRKKLPPELEARGGSLPSALLMHMFHQTLYIHLFRPFLKFSSQTSSTPLSHLDPRKACLHAATSISKYLRFYKHRYKLKQICNVAGYFIHSACTIHLLNLPQKTAARDIIQGLQGLEEMGECWLVARRSLVIIDILVRRWRLKVPEEAAVILTRARLEAKRWGLQEKSTNSSASSPACSDDSTSSRSDTVIPEFSPVSAAAQQGVPRVPYTTYPPNMGSIYAAESPQGAVAHIATSMGAAHSPWQGANAWLLRDQGELGVELAGLGQLGWEAGDVTGVNWEAQGGWPDWGQTGR